MGVFTNQRVACEDAGRAACSQQAVISSQTTEYTVRHAVYTIDIYKKPRCPTSYTTHVKIRSGSSYNLRLTSKSSAVASFTLCIPMRVTNFPNFNLWKTFPIRSDSIFLFLARRRTR